MKFFRKSTAVILALLIISVTAFAGCGGSSTSVTGTWTIKEATYEDKTYSSDQFSDLGLDYLSSMVMTLNEDGTANMSTLNSTADGTWEQKDSTVTVTVEGQPQEFTLKDGVLSADLDGLVMNFVKNK